MPDQNPYDLPKNIHGKQQTAPIANAVLFDPVSGSGSPAALELIKYVRARMTSDFDTRLIKEKAAWRAEVVKDFAPMWKQIALLSKALGIKTAEAAADLSESIESFASPDREMTPQEREKFIAGTTALVLEGFST